MSARGTGSASGPGLPTARISICKPARVEPRDPVADGVRGEGVGVTDAVAAPRGQIVIDDLRGGGVERAGCFVEHAQRWIGNQRPRDLVALALAAAEIRAAFVDIAIV